MPSLDHPSAAVGSDYSVKIAEMAGRLRATTNYDDKVVEVLKRTIWNNVVDAVDGVDVYPDLLGVLDYLDVTELSWGE